MLKVGNELVLVRLALALLCLQALLTINGI